MLRRRKLSPEERKKKREARALREARRMVADLHRIRIAEDQSGGPLLTDWEREFQSEVPERLVEHGRAFYDLSKANPFDPGGPLSRLQTAKARQIRSLVRERLKKRREEAGES